MKQYRPRIADKMLSRRLMGVGAVLIQGPKWCGKTTTADNKRSQRPHKRPQYNGIVL